MTLQDTTQGIDLAGLTPAPAQQWGGVRLLPLLREHPRRDLRIHARKNDAYAIDVADGSYYCAFMPHALIVEFTDDGQPLATVGGHLQGGSGHRKKPRTTPVLHRLAKREDKTSLRFVPLHLAMEGFLAMHFGGPDVAWTEYSREALTRGLSPRWEASIAGRQIEGLAEALRVFEIHEHQVGVLIFVADALASAFVVPHPDDYRQLHRSLLADFYGELLYHYGLLHPVVSRLDVEVDAAKISSLADLEAAIASGRQAWHAYSQLLAGGLLTRQTHWQLVHRAGPFRLRRCISDLTPDQEGHIGEAIHHSDGSLEYLKTYRLSAAQIRRAFLLQQLATNHWNLDRCAAALGDTTRNLVLRLKHAGFGYLLKPHILRGA